MVKHKTRRLLSLDSLLPLLDKPQPRHRLARPASFAMLTRGAEKAAKEKAKQDRKKRQAAKKEEVPLRRSRRISNDANATTHEAAQSRPPPPPSSASSPLPTEPLASSASFTPKAHCSSAEQPPNIHTLVPSDGPLEASEAITPHTLLQAASRKSLPSQLNFLTPQHSISSGHLSAIQHAPRHKRLDPSERDESYFAPQLNRRTHIVLKVDTLISNHRTAALPRLRRERSGRESFRER